MRLNLWCFIENKGDNKVSVHLFNDEEEARDYASKVKQADRFKNDILPIKNLLNPNGQIMQDHRSLEKKG